MRRPLSSVTCIATIVKPFFPDGGCATARVDAFFATIVFLEDATIILGSGTAMKNSNFL
jgi:hypothetical protein